MEATNCENIGIRIQIRENLTDPRITKFLEEKDWNFSLKDFHTFLDSLERPFYNERARQIVEFFVNYRDGLICPDRYNSCDPIKYPFDKNDISDPIAELSFPAGDLYMKKLRKYLVLIYNKSYAIIGDGGVEKVLRPKRVLPEYMGVITFVFHKQWKIDRSFVEQLLRDFCEYLKADYGIMYDDKTGEVLLDLFGNAEKNIYEEKWKSQTETEEYFNNAALNNRVVATNAELGIAGAFNLASPSFLPESGSSLLSGADFSGLTGFETVDFIGAFGTEDWTAGWCNFDPQNTEYVAE